jgi:aryl-alcohol dehydrogenase-like predicted oxidoreductase
MIPRINLTPNYSISKIIKGNWQLAGGHGTIDKQQAIHDMIAFADNGITTFDCADIYTGVEELIGNFRTIYAQIRGAESLSNIKIHTKFVPDLSMLHQVSKHYVETIIDRSLQRLQMEQLDLVQFHWWDYTVPGYLETLGYLTELQRAGKIKHLGLTNFDTTHLKEIIKNGIPIISNQVQLSLVDTRPLKQMSDFCKTNNVQLLCYGTIAGGFLSDVYLGVQEPLEPLATRSLTKYKLIIDDAGGWDVFQEMLGIVHTVAQKHHTDIATIASRSVLDQQSVAAIIVGARNPAHLTSHKKIFTITLDDSDRQNIQHARALLTSLAGDVYELERDVRNKHNHIMKFNLNQQSHEQK